MDLEEWTIRRDFLRKVLTRLTRRQEHVICGILEGTTLARIGDHYDISTSRVRQVAQRSAIKLARLWEDDSALTVMQRPAPDPVKDSYSDAFTDFYSEAAPQYDDSGYAYFRGAHHIKVNKIAKPEAQPEAWRLFWDTNSKMIYWVNIVSNETAFFGGDGKPPP